MLSSCFPQPNHQITKRKKLYEKYRHSERSEPADISECKILRLQKEKSSDSTLESVRFNWLKPRVGRSSQVFSMKWTPLDFRAVKNLSLETWSVPILIQSVSNLSLWICQRKQFKRVYFGNGSQCNDIFETKIQKFQVEWMYLYVELYKYVSGTCHMVLTLECAHKKNNQEINQLQLFGAINWYLQYCFKR